MDLLPATTLPVHPDLRQIHNILDCNACSCYAALCNTVKPEPLIPTPIPPNGGRFLQHSDHVAGFLQPWFKGIISLMVMHNGETSTMYMVT